MIIDVIICDVQDLKVFFYNMSKSHKVILTNYPFNQLPNQPINQLTNQPFNQLPS